jgi:hypothetical protein
LETQLSGIDPCHQILDSRIKDEKNMEVKNILLEWKAFLLQSNESNKETKPKKIKDVITFIANLLQINLKASGNLNSLFNKRTFLLQSRCCFIFIPSNLIR